MSVLICKRCNFFAPTSEIYFTIWWKTLHHVKVPKTTVLYGVFGVFQSCSLSSYISIQTFYLLTFGWKKEKQMSRVTATGICETADFAKKIWEDFWVLPSEHASPWYLQILFVFLLVCGEKILNMQWGFLFHELPAILPRVALGFFIADRSVKRSVLVCWLFRRQSKKKERTEVRSFRGLGL